MFRARIALAAAGAIVVVTAVIAWMVSGSLTTGANQSIDAQTTRAQSTFPALDLLRGIELTNDTAKLAREDEFGEALAKATDEARQAAFVAVQARNARLEHQGRKADLIAVIGSNGHVVCRDLNINAMYDDDLKAKFPSVAKALDGVANKDLWSFDGHMYRVGAAPIRGRGGSIVGALVVGYVASSQDASSDRDRLGSEVAYFLDGKVQASSFKKVGGESAEEKALATQLFDGPRFADGAAGGEMSKLFHVKLGGEEYVGAAGPLPGNLSRSRSGFAVLTSLSAARAPIGSIQMWILVLGLVGLIAAVGAAVLTAIRFIQPLDTIEQGVEQVINGNRDYAFESTSEDFEGLANGLNVMIARLLGRPDPGDDDENGGRWGGEVAVDDQASTTGPQASPENAALAQESEPEYLQRTFNEWVAGRKQTGEGIEGLTLDGFATKLRQNEGALKQKYNCRMVRFKVVVKNNQTTLKPVPIA